MGFYIGQYYYVGFSWWGLRAELLSFDSNIILELYKDSFMED